MSLTNCVDSVTYTFFIIFVIVGGGGVYAKDEGAGMTRAEQRGRPIVEVRERTQNVLCRSETFHVFFQRGVLQSVVFIAVRGLVSSSARFLWHLDNAKVHTRTHTHTYTCCFPLWKL